LKNLEKGNENRKERGNGAEVGTEKMGKRKKETECRQRVL
jgi:hypothetical protein